MDIQQVAKKANVSTATVSRVLNRSPLVRPATAAYVRKVIEQLDYVPNVSARYLRVGHTKLFGLIVSDIKNPFFPDLIDAFEAMAAKQGIDVIFSHTNYDPSRLDHCLRRMVDRNVDGIAVMTSEVDLAALDRVKRSKVPLVLLNLAALKAKFSNVMVDYSGGFEEAIRHLKELGHRNIAFIAGPKDLDSARRRRMAFLAGLKKCGLKPRPDWIVTGDLQLEGGYAAAQQLLKGKIRPTAVMATSDLMAIGALQAAREAGVRVPHDLSIIGFDDIPFCTMLDPALTTISLSRKEIAERAFALLSKAAGMTGRAKISSHSVLPRLKVRASTAQAARQAG